MTIKNTAAIGISRAALSIIGNLKKITKGKNAMIQLKMMYWGNGQIRWSSVRDFAFDIMTLRFVVGVHGVSSRQVN